jgi:hypothetical protein
MAIARGGWRHSRGLLIFVVVAVVVGTPWYLDHLSSLGSILAFGGASSGATPGNLPPTLSMANLTWYFWSTLNSQLLAPLFLIALAGTIWTIVAVVRGEEMRGPRLEFLAGGFVAWLAVSLTPHHDIRYDMPLMPYLAVIGTGWIVHLSRVPRFALTGILVLAVAANTLATTFGVGSKVEIKLVSSPPNTEAFPDRVVFYSNTGFLVAGPSRDGDVPGLLQALGREGIETVTFSPTQTAGPNFSAEGLFPLVRIAGMTPSYQTSLVSGDSKIASLVNQPIPPKAPPTCARLSNGTGIWVIRSNPEGKLAFYCPYRTPQFYALYK